MAVQLPTFADLPSLVPQPSGALPNFKPNDPVAEGEANLGQGFQKAGLAASDTDLYQQLAKDKLEEANATVDLFSRVDPLKAQIAKETDPAKVAELKAQANDLLNTSGQAIANPLRRQMWTAQHTRTIGQLGVEADTRNTVLGREQAVADLHGMADKAIRTAVGSDDPQAMDIAQGAINDAAQYGRQYGAITPDQAYTFTKQRQAQLYVGKADRLLDQGNAGGANALLEQHRGDLDPIALERLQFRIHKINEKQGVVADTNALWGGADKGYTGNRATSAPYDTSSAPDHVDNAEVRTNNFGGMRKPGVPVGGGPQSNPGGWQQFDTPEAGVAAISHQLDRYASGATTGTPLTTIRQIVSTWAPASDNNRTNALISRAAKIVGADPDQPLDLADPGTKAKLIEATIRNEQGGKLPVSPAIIAKVAGGSGGTQVAQAGPQTMTDASPAGLVEPGNIDLTKRPVVKNPDGSISTVKSMSFNEGGKEVLIPTVAADGSGVLSNDAAIAQYRKTGQFLGKFDTPDNATAYAQQLHNSQAQRYGQSQGGLPPLRDINALTQQAQDRADSGEWTQEHANAVQSALRSRYNHVQANQATDRATLLRRMNNGLAMLTDGKDFDIDPATVRHFFPPDQADEFIQKLQDARDGGQLVKGMATAAPADVEQQRAQLAAGLNDPTATDYAKRSRMLSLFDEAAKKRDQALVGPHADPVAYLVENSPIVQQKRVAIAADPKNPQVYQDFATAALAEQTRLGVPPEKQHVLGTKAATGISTAISADAEHAPATMQGLAAQYGQAWPHVYSDLVTLGKLPAGFQVVGQLADYDQANASVLARALGASSKDDKAFERLTSSKAPGGKSIEDVAKQTIPTDERIVSYERSLADSGASPSQIVSIRGAIEHLAAGRAIFLHEAPDEATEKAMDAVVGHYRFMPNGGARVPADKMDTVSSNAGAVLHGLSVDNVSIPAIYGRSPADPKPDEYLTMLQSAPTWITGPKADRLLLLDHGGRLVTGKDGQPVAVPFDMPRLIPLARQPLVPVIGEAP